MNDIFTSNEKMLSWYHSKFKNCYIYEEWRQVLPDQLVLLNLIEQFDVKSILEIGCFKGFTTLLMWLHPNVQRILSVDIHKDMNIPFFEGDHTSLRDKSEYGQYTKNTKAELIFCDSREFKTDEKFDMVFIDANHSYEHTKANSELALKVATKIIAWHDAVDDGNTITMGVRQCLNELKQTIVFPSKNSIIGYHELKT
jgi:predicted O-methyltransferase YrrM